MKFLILKQKSANKALLEAAETDTSGAPDATKNTANSSNLFAKEVGETGKSWDELYLSQGQDPESAKIFWDSYYQEEWGSNKDKILKLNPAFRQELVELGFDEAENPFISFVKNNYIEGEKLPLTAEKYAAIHNAVAKDYISEKVLRSKNQSSNDLTYDGIMLNLLLNNQLYDNTPKDILKYFELADEIIDDTRGPGALQGLGWTDETKKKQLVYYFLINTPDNTAALNKGEQNPEGNPDTTGPLRSIPQVEALIRRILGKVTQKEKPELSNQKLLQLLENDGVATKLDLVKLLLLLPGTGEDLYNQMIAAIKADPALSANPNISKSPLISDPKNWFKTENDDAGIRVGTLFKTISDNYALNKSTLINTIILPILKSIPGAT